MQNPLEEARSAYRKALEGQKRTLEGQLEAIKKELAGLSGLPGREKARRVRLNGGQTAALVEFCSSFCQQFFRRNGHWPARNIIHLEATACPNLAVPCATKLNSLLLSTPGFYRPNRFQVAFATPKEQLYTSPNKIALLGETSA